MADKQLPKDEYLERLEAMGITGLNLYQSETGGVYYGAKPKERKKVGEADTRVTTTEKDTAPQEDAIPDDDAGGFAAPFYKKPDIEDQGEGEGFAGSSRDPSAEFMVPINEQSPETRRRGIEMAKELSKSPLLAILPGGLGAIIKADQSLKAEEYGRFQEAIDEVGGGIYKGDDTLIPDDVMDKAQEVYGKQRTLQDVATSKVQSLLGEQEKETKVEGVKATAPTTTEEKTKDKSFFEEIKSLFTPEPTVEPEVVGPKRAEAVDPVDAVPINPYDPVATAEFVEDQPTLTPTSTPEAAPPPDTGESYVGEGAATASFIEDQPDVSKYTS